MLDHVQIPYGDGFMAGSTR